MVACNLNAAPDAMRRIEQGLSAPHAAQGGIRALLDSALFGRRPA
jgi:hypothetical protein